MYLLFVANRKNLIPLMVGHGFYDTLTSVILPIFIYMNNEIKNFQLCAQLRVCSQAGGIPVYPRFSQPDNSESWDDAGNGI